MNKTLKRLLPWIIVLAAIAALVLFVFVPIYSGKDDDGLIEPEIFFYEGETKPLVMENDRIRFEMDRKTTHFTVTDKTTGSVYYSNPKDAAKDSKAIQSNRNLMQATLVVTYTNSAGSIDMDNFVYSIQNSNFQIEQVSENEISVEYAIGKIEREYMIPSAITKERYDYFRGNMKKSTQKKVASNYSLYEPDKLDKKENKDEVIALYPSVLEQPLYILNAGTTATNKEKLEGYFEEGGYNADEYAEDMKLVAGKRGTTGPVFNVTMNFRLQDNDLVMEVPYSEIRYRADYPITSLTVLPMFGATDDKTDGFILVPEGGGAIIRYNNGKLRQNAYYSNVYGWNYSTYRAELVNETRSNFPVFGMTAGDGSFLCLMEGATSYASIQADISMRNNSYNWARAKYAVLHFDQYNVSTKTTSLVYMYEDEIPDDTIIHRYRFLDSANYVDMANAYGDYLKETGLYENSTASEHTPISVELVGAINKTVVKAGLPVDSVVATTTFDQARQILADMDGIGLENLNIRMSGWANGGINQQVLTGVHILNELGGKDGMGRLIADAKEKGIALYFDGISCFAYDSGMAEGFMPIRDAARLATNEQAKIYPYDQITFRSDDFYDPFYLVRPEFAKRSTDNLIAALVKEQAEGVAFRDIGYLLSGDYNPKDTVTREEVKALNVQSMLDAKAAGQKVMIKAGNDYALPYADIITDVDLTGTKYAILDQQVPFWQIAVHGMKDYTGKPLTLAGDMVGEFLKCVETGSGLNLTFMYEDTKILQDTRHTTFFGSYYASNKEKLLPMALQYQKDMAGLNQQQIISHEQLAEDVVVTGYEDGTKVYVNYAVDAYEKDGVTVNGRSYYVERGK
ncbi:MAG: hypothetical protein E7324_01875 [Clostridiales bacterium]|nr:hypothetical protein [Clostridiales bacterium]